MDWEKLKAFRAAAKTGSLTAAAECLGISQSAISRQIHTLENQINSILFHRHARGLTLTEQGQILNAAACDISLRVSQAKAELNDTKEKVSGHLRISAPVAFGNFYLLPLLEDFYKQYPELNLEISMIDREVNFTELETDISIRVWMPTQNDLVQRKFLTMKQGLYASKSYIKKMGLPNTLEELDQHQIISLSFQPNTKLNDFNWPLWIGKQSESNHRTPFLTVNNLHTSFLSVSSGLAIAALPVYLVHQNPDIIRVLPEIDGHEIEVYFVYPSEIRHTKKLMVFKDYIFEATKSWVF